MNSRRTFIKQAGLAAAGAALLPYYACSPASAKSVGIQLYSLRELLPKDVKGVIQKVAQTGYKEVETYGYTAETGFWGLDAKAFKALLDDNGLKAPSGHFGLDEYIKTGDQEILKPLIAGAAALNMEYFTCPYLSEELRTSLEDYKKVAARLNEAAKLCKESGLQMAYHNHDFEFVKYGDTTGYDILLAETDKNLVHFELDLYWVVRSGNDPIAMFEKTPGRFVMWHVKDMDKTDNTINTEVGNGKIDFKSIHKHAAQAGLKHLIVEQENFSIDPFESIKKSFDYVNRELV
ncbi:sugar phosphate isomerase/epimerase family protein [Pedobacter psychroterrae]|uniref:Sugar phosphate isomerase/epimerase n=1 Tax=Pedobacter psychroterrae TaxID=2530453 RepID=A0A4R0NNG4_9SPHI|nr:sugar phosphate isomerase/epimerase [Pedobacter psychroterrae]TCD02470.1 sugar phosphate isomerase/epimerase [Pedobacter psychroterrae]